MLLDQLTKINQVTSTIGTRSKTITQQFLLQEICGSVNASTKERVKEYSSMIFLEVSGECHLP
jgi:hypothetical protein